MFLFLHMYPHYSCIIPHYFRIIPHIVCRQAEAGIIAEVHRRAGDALYARRDYGATPFLTQKGLLTCRSLSPVEPADRLAASLLMLWRRCWTDAPRHGGLGRYLGRCGCRCRWV